MKRITGILLLLFVFMNQISVQAATRENIQLSMENIEEIIIENSPEFKIIKNNVKKNEEIYDQLIEDFDDCESKISKLKEERGLLTNEEDKKRLDELEKELEKENINLENLKERKRNARYELRMCRIRYEKDLQGLVEKAQNQYIQYVDTMLKKDLKQLEVKIKNKQIEINSLKYGNGFISKKEYEKNLDDITDFNNELKQLENKEENELKDLLFALGIKNEKNVKCDININFDVDKILKINFEEDLDDMLLNNIDLKIKDIENDKLEDNLDNDLEVSDYDIKNNEISLKQEKEKIKMEFEKKYKSLILSSSLIKTQNDKLSRTQDDALIMQTKYNYGFASKKQVDELEVGLNNKNQDFISQVNNLYMDYLSYMKMKDGY
ncbi:viral A-type inclusion protein [Clostridium botulinum]|uniref:TolC family protein n=1 Tax=Clostridium botulinum TaxID=1491 RepID=UPI000772F158|nr:TolC family protein [Clostridium botulinum]NFE84605.1 viral A-type inclusion protein [Clostridium botulinum]NFG37699.1 viral A-type inclusion protein [Clostridium botulinum]NFN28748.1 viral A-type inclusion protein [Clostridium botulinum]NFO01098.1 viral A-type inclusion protein [Clostridium botulinum]NFO51091.1 viral A-type inclusion protein [Clostridium botulinum]